MISLEKHVKQPDELTTELRAILNDDFIKSFRDKAIPVSAPNQPLESSFSETFPGLFDLLDTYGWPSQLETSDIIPTHESVYSNAQDFWLNMYGGYDGAKYLNNFKCWLATRPIPRRQPNSTLHDIVYGLQPALLRAYAVAPELFVLLQSVTSDDEGAPIDEERASEISQQYPDIPEAAFVAYRLLGKLLTPQDEETVFKSLGNNPAEAQRVTDAHQYLWR